jgi:nucleotide-binding universal stress UspA family protein
MFEKVLLPFDGSPLAELVLAQIAPILRRPGTSVVLLRTVRLPRTDYFDDAPTVASLRAEADAYVHELAARLNGAGIPAAPVAAAGPPAETILQTAETRGATMIAMSTHGRTGLSEWVFGSVTEKVIRSSPVPLLVVRSFQPGGNGAALPMPAAPLAVDRILVPVDDVFEPLISPVVACATLFEAEVTVLHVLDPAGRPPALQAAEAKMKEAARALAASGVSVRVLLREGDAAQEILDISREGRFDLIALMTHGRRGESRWALGSVTEKVVHGAALPLLVVRQRGPGDPVGLSPGVFVAPRTI